MEQADWTEQSERAPPNHPHQTRYRRAAGAYHQVEGVARQIGAQGEAGAEEQFVAEGEMGLMYLT